MNHLTDLILYLALIALATYGVYLAPSVGKSLSESTRNAAVVHLDRVKL